MTIADETVLVLGGSGFVGRHVVNQLVREGKRVVVPTRRRENARHLILLPTVDVVNGNIHDPPTLARLVAGASAVVNLVGILNESRRDSFARVHVELAQKMIAACHAAGSWRCTDRQKSSADCFARSLAEDATIGQRYPLCGPDIHTLRELGALVGRVTEHERPIVSLSPALGRLQARVLELLPGTPMSRDNLASMERDSVCDCPFPGIFGVVPASLAAIAPTYLGPAAEKSRYDVYRSQVGR